MNSKPELSPDFTMEDIRKLRTFESELLKKMTRAQRRAYTKEGADRSRIEIERIRNQNNNS